LSKQWFTKPEIRLFVRKNIAQVSAEFIETICRQKSISQTKENFKKTRLNSAKIQSIPPSVRKIILSKIDRDIKLQSDKCDVYIWKVEESNWDYLKTITLDALEIEILNQKLALKKQLEWLWKSKKEIADALWVLTRAFERQKLEMKDMPMRYEKVWYSLKISMSLDDYTKIFGQEQKALHVKFRDANNKNILDKWISVIFVPDGYNITFTQTMIQHELRHSFEDIVFSNTLQKNRSAYTPKQYDMLKSLKSELTATFSKEDGRFLNTKEWQFEQFKKYDYIPQKREEQDPAFYKETKDYQEIIRSSYFYYFDYMTALNTAWWFGIEVVDLLSNQSFANRKTTIEDMETVLLKNGYHQDWLFSLREISIWNSEFDSVSMSDYIKDRQNIDIDVSRESWLNEWRGKNKRWAIR